MRLLPACVGGRFAAFAVFVAFSSRQQGQCQRRRRKLSLLSVVMFLRRKKTTPVVIGGYSPTLFLFYSTPTNAPTVFLPHILPVQVLFRRLSGTSPPLSLATLFLVVPLFNRPLSFISSPAILVPLHFVTNFVIVLCQCYWCSHSSQHRHQYLAWIGLAALYFVSHRSFFSFSAPFEMGWRRHVWAIREKKKWTEASGRRRRKNKSSSGHGTGLPESGEKERGHKTLKKKG